MEETTFFNPVRGFVIPNELVSVLLSLDAYSALIFIFAYSRRVSGAFGGSRWTISELVGRCNISYAAARKSSDALVTAGVLVHVDKWYEWNQDYNGEPITLVKAVKADKRKKPMSDDARENFLSGILPNKEACRVAWEFFKAMNYDTSQPSSHMTDVGSFRFGIKRLSEVVGKEYGLIHQAVQTLRQKSLTISTPMSLVKTILHLKNGRVIDPVGTPVIINL